METKITKRISLDGYRELLRSSLVTGGLLKVSAALVSDNGEWEAGGDLIFGRPEVVGFKRGSVLVKFDAEPEAAMPVGDSDGELIVSIW